MSIIEEISNIFKKIKFSVDETGTDIQLELDQNNIKANVGIVKEPNKIPKITASLSMEPKKKEPELEDKPDECENTEIQ